MSVATVLSKYGLLGAAQRALKFGSKIGKRRFHRWRTRQAPRYEDPQPSDLKLIENRLREEGIEILDYEPDPSAFRSFQDADYFPSDYHGGKASGVWDEKMLEHWISSELLGLKDYHVRDIYVDVAACGSPWAKVVRDRFGLETFAIDLSIAPPFRDLSFYRAESATRTSFATQSVRGVSLHCAYEMFIGNDDVEMLSEMARILKPGGKMVILPLYMHTHYCAYSTPEYFGKGYSDPGAKEYLRTDSSGVPSSRKYDAQKLVERVLLPITRLGMSYRLLALRNKNDLGTGIYCHFILEVTR